MVIMWHICNEMLAVGEHLGDHVRSKSFFHVVPLVRVELLQQTPAHAHRKHVVTADNGVTRLAVSGGLSQDYISGLHVASDLSACA